MIYTLRRVEKQPERTFGELLLNGEKICWTLEDTWREPGSPKVPGRTCIPAGTYPLKITWSPRFKRNLPLVENVPGFSGIRIHPGNTEADTEGCVLPGLGRTATMVTHSRAAYDLILPPLQAALDRGTEVWLTVVDPPTSCRPRFARNWPTTA